ncbi:MAG: molybdopterin molybdotransferase MoeA [Alcanivoracaceae bacterium]|nr:molybdopterin molybdotransferase MoeA [Alcanivoracaceae bacterium]
MTVNSKKNLTNKILINYQQALDIIKQISNKHKVKNIDNIPLVDATQRLLAADYLSPINVPPFNNSAMDGFAIQRKSVNELFNAQKPIKLQVTGSIQAGDNAEIVAQANTDNAWEIMTGAPVPSPFDAVIQIENVEISENEDGKFITFNEEIKENRNIRKLGTDYQLDQLVTNKHTQIQAQHIMALATVGIENIDVLSRIKVAILSTGNELAKKSDHTLNSGKIHNSNQPFLKEYCKNLNCEPVFVGRCKDNIKDFNKLIDSAISKQVKIIFSTGAVSMGKHDFIPQALIQRGAKIHFHKAKIRPGKPILFAELANKTLYFGLPGNPIAAASGMRFFAAPLIRNMLGLSTEKLIKAKLLNNLDSKRGFRTFAKAFASIDKHGQLCVDMLLDQGSYQSRSFAQSNCWLIIPEDRATIHTGELINIAPMIPNHMIF